MKQPHSESLILKKTQSENTPGFRPKKMMSDIKGSHVNSDSNWDKGSNLIIRKHTDKEVLEIENHMNEI